jgi:hypothetical protein
MLVCEDARDPTPAHESGECTAVKWGHAHGERVLWD